jgi:hypothetical protein
VGLRENKKQEAGKLNNQKFYHLYFSPSKTRVMKSRRMRWAGRTGHNQGDKFIVDFDDEM